MADNPVITGALAIVKVNGEAIGKMQNIRVNENTRRQEVRGLGTILPKEAPVVEWSGTISCSFYNIDFSKSQIPGAIRRQLQTNQQFEDQQVLDDEGVQIDIFKKVRDAVDPNTGLILPQLTPFAIVRDVLLESENFDISEGQISGRDQSFLFLSPIIYPQ